MDRSENLRLYLALIWGRGTPRLKPKIIRGAKDYGQRAKRLILRTNPNSPIISGILLGAYSDGAQLPCLSKKYGNTLLYQNGRRIESWLKKVVAIAHEGQNEDEFAAAEDILNHISQDLLWEFERKDLVEIIQERDFSHKKTNSYILCELVQTLCVSLFT